MHSAKPWPQLFSDAGPWHKGISPAHSFTTFCPLLLLKEAGGRITLPHLLYLAMGYIPGIFLVLSKRNKMMTGLSDAVLILSLQSTHQKLCRTKLVPVTSSHIWIQSTVYNMDLLFRFFAIVENYGFQKLITNFRLLQSRQKNEFSR